MSKLVSKQFGFGDESGKVLYMEIVDTMVQVSEIETENVRKVVLFDDKEEIEYLWPIKEFLEVLEEMQSIVEDEVK